MTENTFAENRYERMTYRRCGRSGLMLPVVSLGLWQNLGDPGMEQTARRCCFDAFDLICYGDLIELPWWV